MSTSTPVAAPRTPGAADESPGPRRWWRIALVTLVAVLALFAVGFAVWQFAPQFTCGTSAAADPRRSGAITEYCLPGRLQSTNGGAMTVGLDGNLWVAYYAHATVARVTPQGVLTEFAVSPAPAAPPIPFSPGIVRGPDGNLWYMAEGKVVRMNTRGEVVGQITPPADMATLGSIAVGPNGNIWLANYIPAYQGSSDKVAEVTPTGQFTEYSLPPNVAVVMVAGPDGNLWMPLVDTTLGRLTPSGVLTRFPTDTGLQTNQLTIGPDGNIWFIDTGGHVGRMAPTGSVAVFDVARPQSYGTAAIGSGPDGNIWFSAERDKIGRITSSGVVTTFTLPQRGDVSAITAGPDGGVWFLLAPTDFPASVLQPARIVRITP